MWEIIALYHLTQLIEEKMESDFGRHYIEITAEKLLKELNNENEYFRMEDLQESTNKSQQFLKKVKNGWRPPIPSITGSPTYVKLMTQCWDSDPNNRPTFIEIRNQLKTINENELQ